MSYQPPASYKVIARQFGLTEYQLDLLFRFKRGDQISGNNTGPVLDRKGYTSCDGSGYNRRITEQGLAVCAQVRREP